MKIKSLIIFLFIIFSVNTLANAQNLNFKSYTDNTNGFNGVAAVLYIDNINKYNLEIETSDLNKLMVEFYEGLFNKLFPLKGKTFDKLSSNNYWLCQQALNELNTKKGEIYMIMCADNMSPVDFVVIMAIIGNDGKSFTWWGKTFLTNEFE